MKKKLFKIIPIIIIIFNLFFATASIIYLPHSFTDGRIIHENYTEIIYICLIAFIIMNIMLIAYIFLNYKYIGKDKQKDKIVKYLIIIYVLISFFLPVYKLVGTNEIDASYTRGLANIYGINIWNIEFFLQHKNIK